MHICIVVLVVFFFQAEDGIRDKLVTGVQTCALPISLFPGNPKENPSKGFFDRRSVAGENRIMKKPRSWKSRLGAGKLEQACKPVDGFILVAEDDDDQFFLLSLALEKAGIANPLLRARNGQDVLDYIEGTSPCPARTEPPIPVL